MHEYVNIKSNNEKTRSKIGLDLDLDCYKATDHLSDTGDQ